ncbi:MAG TPA: NUDIX domain-containing protein [Terriglobales bacterium]|nr:NUDIX domain-containing protein [Terriglobales bacterium]
MATATKFFHLSKLQRLSETEQVAAVCYRLRGNDVEFLLVQTGGGRWIFPKGSVEPGLTHAQAAAIEAFEEAGVHGRIEEKSFFGYRVRRTGKKGPTKQTVMTHLCEVRRLAPPQETGRNRTWFTADKAKQRLRKDRTAEEGKELARVVSRAVIRIAGAQSKKSSQVRPEYLPPLTDPLQKVQLETAAIGRSQHSDPMYVRYIRRLRSDAELLSDDGMVGAFSKPRFRLGSSTVFAAIEKVTAIDQIRRNNSKPKGR